MNRNICADLKTNWIKSGGSGARGMHHRKKVKDGVCHKK